MIDINKQPDPLPKVLPTGTRSRYGTAMFGWVLTKSLAHYERVGSPGNLRASSVDWPSYYEALEKQRADTKGSEPFDPIAYAGEKLKGWAMPETGRPDEFVFRAPDHEPGSTSGIRVQATHGEAETMAEVERVLSEYNKRRDARMFDPVAYAREKLVGWDLEKRTNYALFCAPDWQAGVAGRRCRIWFDDSKEQSTNAISRVLKAYNECQAAEPKTCSKCDEPFDVYRRPFFTDICSNCSERETINNEPLDARIAAAKAEHKAEHPKPVKHPWGAWSTATWDAP